MHESGQTQHSEEARFEEGDQVPTAADSSTNSHDAFRRFFSLVKSIRPECNSHKSFDAAAPRFMAALTPAAVRLKELEEQLATLHKRGNEKNEYIGGYGGGHLHASSFADVEKHEAERRALAQQVKEARAALKAERQVIKGHASSFNDPSVWTKTLLAGDERFEKADDGIERELAQATYGLVSASDFKETKARLERKRSEELAGAESEAARRLEEAEEKKRLKRQKQRQQQAARLSFVDDEEGGVEAKEEGGVALQEAR
jgi:hypothetical protein